jgi:molybdopterin synthase catalytic subunit
MMTAMARVLLADVVTEPIHARDVAALVTGPEAGAVVTFSGDVRDHDHGRHVASLEYEGHPTAAAVLAECAAEIAAKHPVVAVAAVHRVGPLAIGDSALVAAVASAHRAEAFAACAELVDVIKERLPVWKHQVFADGTDEWVNCA